MLLRLILLFTGLATSADIVAENAAILDINRLFAAPDLDGPAPKSVKISPDSSRIGFLRGKTSDPLRMDLWEYNLEDNKVRLLVDSAALAGVDETLSEEELARRERLRQVGRRGIASYQFSPSGEFLLFPLGGDLYLYGIEDSSTRRLTDSEAAEIDARFSSTGRYISFVRDDNLYTIDLESGSERQITHDGGGPIKYGVAEFVAQEEMDRYEGYWWSPDDSAIAFTKVDESSVTLVDRFEIHADAFSIYQQRYPSTGTPNARVALATASPDGGETRWLAISETDDFYLARVDWFPDGRHLAVQTQSRDQHTLDLTKFDRISGEATHLISETSDTWTDLHNDLTFLPSGGGFVWSSDRSGHRHLYLYDSHGKLIRALTSGDWDVVDGARTRSAVLHVDESRDRVYFTATLDSPIERNVYVVSLSNPQAPRRISLESGWHRATFAPNGAFYVDSFESTGIPPRVSVHNADGDRIAFIEENRLDETHPYFPYLATRPTIEFGTLTAEDGQALYYRLIKPHGLDKSARHPAVVYVYGGPHGQSVTRTWNVGLNEILARNGFVVFTLDNRGTGFRGVEFDAPIYKRLGHVEVRDQVAGARYLGNLEFVDPRRIGIWGWSYGGYMSLMAMFQHPDEFAAGVSGAPVTDWALYDTHYTERYLASPQQNTEGYRESAVLPYLEGLSNPLLLIHGMADDNVLFTHSTKLYKALQDANKPFDVMTYPGAKHSLIRVPKTGEHVGNHILRFLARHLAAEIDANESAATGDQ